MPFDPKDPAHEQAFESEGLVLLRGMVSPSVLEPLVTDIRQAFERARASGTLFDGGGMISGHLNCFPGAGTRRVYDELERVGVLELLRRLDPRAVRLPNIGCNMNLPGSNPQNRHIDGYAASAFGIVNVAAVDTNLENGAMEVLPGTSRREYKYWQLVVEGPKAVRPTLSAGDVVIRTSALWHRGMPNLSARPRPMLAFTWEDGGSQLDDPFAQHGGEIRFFPNRYQPTRLGRLRERAFVAAPSIPSAYRFVRSFFE